MDESINSTGIEKDEVVGSITTIPKEQVICVHSPNSKSAVGLSFSRLFSRANTSVYDSVKWIKRDAVITNEKGEKIFEQKDVEVPESWSQMAVNVVVSKYFRGVLGTKDRETSVRQLISRVADTISAWGFKDKYFTTAEQAEVFRDELSSILLKQYAAFNSPVWFNVGIEKHPQCSACFILSVSDTLESLLELQKTEGMLFKYGSGAGTNMSKIRSSREGLSGGGIASGPVSFMRGFDAWAGTIKSGGKTRRAAKMQILDIDHPDIKEFITAKQKEEEKAWNLIEQGYDGGFNVQGGAYDSVFFQNANLSVRVSDEFMKAVEKGDKFWTTSRRDGAKFEECDAKELLRLISEGTWICGDPGLQFDTIINEWHTCPNSGKINASNPCSEYMHLDNSACNLASINLLKFFDEQGQFDISLFKHTVGILITAQDILVDNASYPTVEITNCAHSFRQLGLGFANLGAVLMSQGLPYDSEEGRILAASLMSLLCAEAYLMSSNLAKHLGAFEGFAANRNEMLKIIGKHATAADKLTVSVCSESILLSAKECWSAAIKEGEISGYRNSQTTVLAPTGTIAFLMDCDTTGLEPDIALVKYKKLVGGGVLKIVNNTVKLALERLGYNNEQIVRIIEYIDKNDTIEGAPDLDIKHLSVFDCAFKPFNGNRFINYTGHIKMMSAIQPFVSGAISKTVNMPESATVEDIYRTYLEAWHLGLKAIAIYRDNSKRSQPLATSKDERDKATNTLSSGVYRRHLPNERQAITHKFSIAGHEGYLTVGLYEDKTPGEIFIVMAKEGSTISGVMDAFATSISIALQYGVPLQALVRKFSHMRFEPAGFTSNKDIPIAKSVLDYIFRYLGFKFLSSEQQLEAGIQAVMSYQDDEDEKVTAKNNDSKNDSSIKVQTQIKKNSSKKYEVNLGFQLSDDAPPCSVCGSSLMIRQGACYRCLTCGSQGGCG